MYESLNKRAREILVAIREIGSQSHPVVVLLHLLGLLLTVC